MGYKEGVVVLNVPTISWWNDMFWIIIWSKDGVEYELIWRETGVRMAWKFLQKFIKYPQLVTSCGL
jgi:hypothetical protein